MTLSRCLAELCSGIDGKKVVSKTKFTEYTGIKGRTPQHLSLDHYQNYVNIHPELHENGIYLFRLGRGCFSLVESENILQEYFVEDSIFPEKKEADTFHPLVNRICFPFLLCLN